MIVYAVMAPSISGHWVFVLSLHDTREKAQAVINKLHSSYDYGKMSIEEYKVN